MSYKNMSELVILNKYGLAGVEAKAELFETYDQLRDLTVSGPSIGGSGLGGVGSFLFKMAQMVSGSSFLPVLGNSSVNIPGTSYFNPIQPGTSVQPGGQSPFGLGPFGQTNGFPTGSAAGFNVASVLSSAGIGNASNAGLGIGDPQFSTGSVSTGMMPYGQMMGGMVAGGAAALGSMQQGGMMQGSSTLQYGASGNMPYSAIPGGTVAGGAFGLGAGAGMAAAGAGVAGAAGFGRNMVLPAAGIVSGIGGLLTTLAPLMGGAGLAGLATGTILSGLSGSLLSAYQHVSNRVLVNADTILTNKVKNLETVVKQLDAQEEVIKKLLKDSVEGDKKALQDL